MAIEFYAANLQDLFKVVEERAELVLYEDYLRLQTAAKKALEALGWNWGGEPLPTLELEAIELLKKELGE